MLAYQTQAREMCKNMWEQDTPHQLYPFLCYLFLHPAALDVDVMSGVLTSQLVCSREDYSDLERGHLVKVFP